MTTIPEWLASAKAAALPTVTELNPIEMEAVLIIHDDCRGYLEEIGWIFPCGLSAPGGMSEEHAALHHTAAALVEFLGSHIQKVESQFEALV